MADVITRFKLETTQFDSKLRDSSKNLSEIARIASLAGKDFDSFTQKSVESARALGQTASGATSTKDRLKDLVGAFNDTAKAYNNLTQEQKQTDFGRAMAQSLQELKARIGETKQDMNDTGGVLSQLKDKFTINIDAVKLFSVGLTAAKAALDVAKDAFFASEANLDEWGRTVRSAESLYDGFLTALNTGDISGYLSRIGEITQAAREAYDALDKLSTQKAMDNAAIKGKQTEVNRMRAMLQTGRYIAPADGRTAAKGMQDGQLLTDAQKRTIEKQITSATDEIVTLMRSEVKTTGEAIDALYNQQAKELGMSLKEFRAGTANMDVFQKMLSGYEQYKKFENDHTTTTTYTTSNGLPYTSTVRDNAKNPYEQFKAWGVFKDDGKLFTDINKLIDRRAALQSQVYSTQSGVYRSINRVEGISPKIGSGGGKGDSTTITPASAAPSLAQDLREAILPSGTTESMKELEAQLRTYNELLRTATTQEEYRQATEGIEDTKKRMEVQEDALHMGVNTDQMLEWKETLSQSMKKSFESAMEGFDPSVVRAEDDNKKNKGFEEFNKSLQSVTTAMSGLNSVMGGLQQMGINVDKSILDAIGFIQGLISVVQGVSSIIQIFSTSSQSANTIAVGLNTGAVTALTAAMATNSLTNLIPLARGGIVHAEGGVFVPGNHYSGDMVPAMLNSGELVLNRAQQGNLAAQLTGEGNTPALSGLPYVSGEQIFLGVNNWLRSTGQGEIVVSR